MSYTLQAEADRITLKTTSFKAEKGSVLHSGIYSRELSASFVAAVVTIICLMVLYFFETLNIITAVTSMAVFGAVFILSRIYIFRDPYLECVFDKTSQTVTVSLRRPLRSRRIQRSLDALKDIRIVHRRFEIDNPDAVEFVEKIALQHGTVLPGFGEPEEFYEVVLEFDDMEVPVLAVKDRSSAEEFVQKLKRFL